jgi:putative glutamine amidotransferase
MQPVILISTARQRLAVNHSAGLAMNVLNSSFVDLLMSLECIPLLVAPGMPLEAVARLFTLADGLLLASGQDICPSHYEEDLEVTYTPQITGMGKPYTRPMMLSPDKERDALELQLYREAKARKLPILGVCRGMQLINVAEGGTLFQEIPHQAVEHGMDTDGWINYHPIEVDSTSQLYKIVQKNTLSMSSVHHQAVKHLASSLKANAIAGDGLIEGLELNSDTHFVLGMQGHIEKTLANHPENLQIWKRFVSEAAKRSL